MTVLSFVLLLSLQQRNVLVLHAGDHLLRSGLFWCMFLPLGERWSLDARRSNSKPRAACGLALAYVLCSNVLALPTEGRAMPQPAAVMGRTFGLDQRWHMFANTRATYQGWHVLVGYLPNGLPINIATDSTEISFDQPELHALDYSNHNWRIYWSSIGEERNASFRPVLADYPCINNGVYRCGFATQQAAYSRALVDLFGALDRVEHIQSHYFASHRHINPHGIIPDGPALDFEAPHGRG